MVQREIDAAWGMRRGGGRKDTVHGGIEATLIKKKIKFSSYIGKFRVEQLQSYILGRAS
jgi:hypothetical protein